MNSILITLIAMLPLMPGILYLPRQARAHRILLRTIQEDSHGHQLERVQQHHRRASRILNQLVIGGVVVSLLILAAYRLFA